MGEYDLLNSMLCLNLLKFHHEDYKLIRVSLNHVLIPKISVLLGYELHLKPVFLHLIKLSRLIVFIDFPSVVFGGCFLNLSNKITMLLKDQSHFD